APHHAPPPAPRAHPPAGHRPPSRRADAPTRLGRPPPKPPTTGTHPRSPRKPAPSPARATAPAPARGRPSLRRLALLLHVDARRRRHPWRVARRSRVGLRGRRALLPQRRLRAVRRRRRPALGRLPPRLPRRRRRLVGVARLPGGD